MAVEQILCSQHSTIKQSTLAEVTEQALIDLVKRLNISFVSCHYKPGNVVEQRLRERCKKWQLGPPEGYKEHFLGAVIIATTAYGHTRVETQLEIASYTFLLILIDDFRVSAADLETFPTNLYRRLPQPHPILNYVVEVLDRMSLCFDRYAATAITVSTLQFLNSMTLEAATEGLPLRKGAQAYVDYKRLQSSIAESFAHFAFDKSAFPSSTSYIQMISESMTFITRGNDMLSFYKETLAGEKGNYIDERTAVTGKSPSTVLVEMVDEAVAAVERARDILAEEHGRTTFDRFIAGYIYYHVYSPRYRLRELKVFREVLQA